MGKTAVVTGMCRVIIVIVLLCGLEGSVYRPVDASPAEELYSPPVENAHNSAAQAGEWIAFIGKDGNVWLIHPDGSELRQVTNDASKTVVYYNLKWSPQGNLLAFSRDTVSENLIPSSSSIQLLDPVINKIDILISQTGGDFDWYLNGEKIIYDEPSVKALSEGPSDDWSKVGRLLTIDITTRDSQQTANPKSKPYRDLKLSPSGSWLIYLNNQTDCSCSSDDCVIDLNPPYSLLFPNKSESSLLGCQWAHREDIFACVDDRMEDVNIYNTKGGLVSKAEPNGNGILEPGIAWSNNDQNIAIATRENIVLFSKIDQSIKNIGTLTGWDYNVITWSPDDHFLVVYHYKSSSYYLVDVKNGDKSFLVEGLENWRNYYFAWQPGTVVPDQQPPAPPAYLEPAKFAELLQEKNALIPRLEKVVYDDIYGVSCESMCQLSVYESVYKVPCSSLCKLNVYDEEKVAQLVKEFEQNPGKVPDEQKLAFNRLLMQEKALAATLGDYTILSRDFADSIVDLSGMTIGLISLTPTIKIDEVTKINLNFAESTYKFFAGKIPDEKIRDAVQNGFSAAFDFFRIANGDPKTLAKFIMEPVIRWTISKHFIDILITSVQSTIDKGVRSAALQDDAWQVQGTDAATQLQMDHIIFTSNENQKTAHDIHNSLQRGLELNEVLKNIADLLATGNPLPYFQAARFWTRVQQGAVDLVSNDVVADGMDCIINVSSKAGELAFQPGAQLPTCPMLLGNAAKLNDLQPSTSYVDKEAWEKYQPTLETSLVDYQQAVQSMQAAFQKEDNQSILGSIADFEKARDELAGVITIGYGLLLPPAGEVLSPETEALAKDILAIQGNSIGLTFAAYAMKEDQNNSEAKAVFDQFINEASGNASQLQNDFQLSRLFNGPGAGIPVITEVPQEVIAEAGKEVTFDVGVSNIGSLDTQSGTVKVLNQNIELQTISLPAIQSGQVANIPITITVGEEGQSMLLVKVRSGTYNDYRMVPLTVTGLNVVSTPVEPWNYQPVLFSVALCILAILLVGGGIGSILIFMKYNKSAH